jgi:hypothetical protein
MSSEYHDISIKTHRKRALMFPVLGDGQVSTVGAHIMARSFRAVSLGPQVGFQCWTFDTREASNAPACSPSRSGKCSVYRRWTRLSNLRIRTTQVRLVHDGRFSLYYSIKHMHLTQFLGSAMVEWEYLDSKADTALGTSPAPLATGKH